MKTQSTTSKGLIGAGLLTAIAASLCCITPVLALIAGTSGIAATFSWLEPARPFLTGFTVLVLSLAWWQKLKLKKAGQIDCACEENEKLSFWQSKKFLGIVTVFAALMLAFPYYSYVFYPATKANIVVVESQNIQQADFRITGMTCSACEEHVKQAVAQLPGFIDVSADNAKGTAWIRFDKSKSTIDDVVAAINETGYKVTGYQITNNQ